MYELLAGLNLDLKPNNRLQTFHSFSAFRNVIRYDPFDDNYMFTAWAIATSCCISDVSSQWEGAIFDPP